MQQAQTNGVPRCTEQHSSQALEAEKGVGMATRIVRIVRTKPIPVRVTITTQIRK
ncbi:hypothetical protein GCM10027415_37720 [Humibacter ginsengisoli]